ncbi:hypothetical protein BA6E_1153 [Bacteroidales bacterium 6E]|nr:hypothetical protein BA6E_1153 [Bacteroidales bacterium 6E]
MKKTTTLLLMLGVMLCSLTSIAQVRVDFKQRESIYTPGKKIYNIKGDFQMIGNTNLTLQDYSDGGNNSSSMEYVDIDGDATTLNSSSATLNFSNENGATPECSNIIYAGLYWTGRAHDGGTSPGTFMVGETNTNMDDDETVNGYTLNITQTASGDIRTATYTFTPSSGSTVLFTFVTDDNDATSLTVKVGNGTATNVPYTSSGATRFVEDWRQVFLTTPYVINTGSTTLVVNSLRKSTENNTIDDSFYANVTYGGKLLNKQVVKLKKAGGTYQTVTANPTDIYYPSNADGNMYSAYAEVTDYVREHGIGEYFVADIALREGSGGNTGYYGGWGMIVVYENSKMKWRDVTIFDGHAYVASGAGYGSIPVSGFNTVQNGPVSMKLGLMAGEGDRSISGDYFQIRNHNNTQWIDLNHSLNLTTNFFNSSVNTGDNDRNPVILNNTGLDIAMFDIANDNNSVITNNQTSTTFRYYSNQDTYVIFCVAMAVDAYIPDPEAYNLTTTVNGVPVSGSVIYAQPGQEIEYTLEVRNKGTEAINNAVVTIPIPYTTSYVSSSAVYYEGLSGPQPSLNASAGATGSIEWNIGSIPLPADNNTLLAKMTYKVKVTTNCYILSNPNCDPVVTIDGGVSGVGVTSGVSFSNRPFVQGFETTGICQGEPITDPVVVTIDRTNYICNDQDYTVLPLSYCNISGSTIPFTDVYGNFPAGTRFYSSIDTSGEPTGTGNEYTNATGFPATSGITTYYAIPPGITLCWWEFTIEVTNITTTPTVQDVEYCQGETAVPLTATPTDDGYILYYYTSATGGTATTSITPSTATVGTVSYWVAEGSSGQCISPNRAKIDVNVNANPVAEITGPDGPACPNAELTYNGPADMDAYEWTVSGDASISGSNTGSSVTVIAAADCEGSFTVSLEVTKNGCTDETSKDVTIEDKTAPVIAYTTDISVNTNSGSCTALVTVTAPSVSDNCANVSATGTRSDGLALNDPFPKGETTITWNATDACQNSATPVIQKVTVIDNIVPTVVTQNITVQLDANGAVTITPAQINNGSTDNCAISTYALDVTSFDCSDVGPNMVTLTVTDVNGNSATGTATVTVEDDNNPTIVECAPTQTISADAECAALVPDFTINVVAGDNCEGSEVTNLTITQSPAVGTSVGIGTHTTSVSLTDQA